MADQMKCAECHHPLQFHKDDGCIRCDCAEFVEVTE